LRTDLAVVLVDDEISTGATALDAIRSMQEIHPRTLYVVASLVDMRTDDNIETCLRRAADLDTTVEFISLARGTAVIPPDLTERVVGLHAPATDPRGRPGATRRVDVDWPAHVPDGGRYGFGREDWPDFDRAVAEVAAAVSAAHLDPARPLVVIGHEELMYLPQRVAAELSAHVDAPIVSQTTTRSPAHVIDDPGYPLRRGYHFDAPEPDEARDRYVYNATHDFDDAQIVMIVDAPADTATLTAPGGLTDVLTGRGDDVLLVVVPGTDYLSLKTKREHV
jgi:hypothetical protein